MIDQPQLLSMILLLSPLVLVLTALVSWWQPGIRPALVKRMSIGSTIVGFAVFLLGAWLTYQHGLVQSPLLGMQGLGFSLRLDALSMLMLGMISVISFIVIKFSLNYLDGDSRQGAFLGRMTATIAAVQLLVLSGNLGLLLFSWVLTSISLHRLLIFYHERSGAIIAARKKFIIARISDLFLASVVFLLYDLFGTGDIQTIFLQIKESSEIGTISGSLSLAAICLVLSAIFKSAQFPSHGWLLEVMETPTPVSALLHAGLLNAGPFLMIRLAPVLETSITATTVLIIVAGFTALFGSVVFMTQTSVKTALSYSSIAHMGFSLLACGLGAYSAAMLHLVAHSFYKAHSFLSSGSVIEQLRAARIAPPQRHGNAWLMIVGVLLAAAVYVGTAWVWGIHWQHELSLLAIGAVIVMGMARLLATTFDSTSSPALIGRVILQTALIASSFFLLESGMSLLLAGLVPATNALSFGQIIILSVLLLLFASVTIIQAIAPVMKSNSTFQALAIHLRNGLYINIIFDRLVGTWRTKVLADYTSTKVPSATLGEVKVHPLKEQHA